MITAGRGIYQSLLSMLCEIVLLQEGSSHITKMERIIRIFLGKISSFRDTEVGAKMVIIILVCNHHVRSLQVLESVLWIDALPLVLLVEFRSALA